MTRIDSGGRDDLHGGDDNVPAAAPAVSEVDTRPGLDKYGADRDQTAPASVDTPSRFTLGDRAVRLLVQNGLLVILLIWVIYLAIATDSFATKENILLVLRQSSIIGVVAIGATLVIMLGEIDLSLGAVVSLCGVVAAKVMINGGVGVVVGGICAVGLGVACGLVNGLLVTKLRINSFMATLGMMSVLGGLAFIETGGKTLFGPALTKLSYLSTGDILGLPFPVVLLFLFYFAGWVVFTRTGYGARLYAVGNNARASYLAGIRVDAVLIATFALSGALAGFGGLMEVARLDAASGGLGTDLLFPVVTAVVLGGISLTGGRGRVQDVLVASIFLATITNGLVLLGVSGYTQQVVSGAILILALALDRWRRSL